MYVRAAFVRFIGPAGPHFPVGGRFHPTSPRKMCRDPKHFPSARRAKPPSLGRSTQKLWLHLATLLAPRSVDARAGTLLRGAGLDMRSDRLLRVSCFNKTSEQTPFQMLLRRRILFDRIPFAPKLTQFYSAHHRPPHNRQARPAVHANQPNPSQPRPTMLFRPSALLGLAATALLLSAARAHNHDKAAEAVATPSLRVAAKDSDPAAVKAMTVRVGSGCRVFGRVCCDVSTQHTPKPNQVTLPNPTNSWEDKKQGKWFSQTQVFLTNTGTKAICEVKVRPSTHAMVHPSTHTPDQTCTNPPDHTY